MPPASSNFEIFASLDEPPLHPRRRSCNTPAVMELLGDEGVTEKNLMQYLGIIEQRTNEILQVRLPVLCCAVLFCSVLCCAVLCCAVLCCAVLCCAVLCCAVLCCAVLCCAVLCCAACCACCRLQPGLTFAALERTGGGTFVL